MAHRNECEQHLCGVQNIKRKGFLFRYINKHVRVYFRFLGPDSGSVKSKSGCPLYLLRHTSETPGPGNGRWALQQANGLRWSSDSWHEISESGEL